MPKPLERRERNREYDRYRGSARKRGYTAAWDRAAAEFKRKNPLCKMCADAGRVTPTYAVDHIIPKEVAPELFWERSNWQPLCRRHHNSDKQRIERGGKPRSDVDQDGWPTS